MPGSYGVPYRPPYGGWITPRLVWFGSAWQHARPADVIDRWLNQTLVRIYGTPITDNNPPFGRKVASTWDPENPGAECHLQPPGFCGTWLNDCQAALISAQEVEDTVDDIMACASPDATHVTKDHNCYAKSGTKDFRTCHKLGGKWVLARKCWHGSYGLQSLGRGTDDPNNSPDQTRYLKSSLVVTGSVVTLVPSQSYDDSNTLDFEETQQIGRYTGVKTITSPVHTRTMQAEALSVPQPYTDSFIDGDFGFFEWAQGITFANGGLVMPTGGSGPASNLFLLTADYQAAHGPIVTQSDLSAFLNSLTFTAYTRSYARTVSVTFTDTELSFSFSENGYDPTYDPVTNPSVVNDNQTISFAYSLNLSVTYTAADCYADLLALLAAWDLSDDKVYPHRRDEQLANAPMIIYDEVGPTALESFFVGPFMDDLNSPVNDKSNNAPWTSVDSTPPAGWTYNPTNNGTPILDANNVSPNNSNWTPTYDGTPISWVPTYAQITYVDPRDYAWRYSNGSYSAPVYWSSATLVTPLHDGSIIAHSQAGSDRHFWFAAQVYVRVFDSGAGTYNWEQTEVGSLSDANLPETALRWLPKISSQYDSGTGLDAPPPGLWPQAWIHEKDAVAMAMKYVEAKESWKSVNFARPCGPDKFAADQTTVCCVLSGDAGSGFVVKKTGNAINPLDADGIAVSDYIIVSGDGVYQVSSITDDGTITDGDGNSWHQFTIHASSKIDDAPTGYDISSAPSGDPSIYLGRLRWWAAPGICGRVAITTAFAAGTVTVTPATAQPYLRTGAVVDICDATMSVLASAQTLTRVNDTSFTFSGSAVPTAAWLVPHLLFDGTTAGTKYYFYDDQSKRSFNQFVWTFNPRATDPGYTSPPTWYGDVAGCLTLTVTQAGIAFVPCCPAMVGIVPFSDGSPVETFTNQNLLPFPDTFTFDSKYGAHWQAAVETTMRDPFYQEPFKPDCEVFAPDVLNWGPDDGTGLADSEDGSTKYFPAAPLVEAMSAYPTDAGPMSNETPPTLPSGISLAYDTALNTIPPPYYPNGIPIGDAAGNYASVIRAYGFYLNACANIHASGRFSGDYALFVVC